MSFIVLNDTKGAVMFLNRAEKKAGVLDIDDKNATAFPTTSAAKRAIARTEQGKGERRPDQYVVLKITPEELAK